MKCKAKVIKNRKPSLCNKECNFIYCEKHWSEKWKTNWKKVTAVLVVFSLLVGTVINWKEVKSWFKSDHENFIEGKYIEAILAPFNYGDSIKFKSGPGWLVSEAISPDPSEIPVTFQNDCNDRVHPTFVDPPIKFSWKIVNHRFLLSLKVIDLNNDVVAEIRDNKIELVKDKIGDYTPIMSTPQALEIIDNAGYVVFSMWVDQDNSVQLRGYFVGPICTMFLNGGPYPGYIQINQSDYESTRKIEASKIPRHFPKTI